MISFKREDEFVELPKKLNIAQSRHDETIPNEDYHFYRFFVADQEINEIEENHKIEDNQVEDQALLIEEDIVPEETQLTLDSFIDIPVCTEASDSSNIDSMTPLQRFYEMVYTPDLLNASFLDIKLWALLHMHFQTGIDYEDLLSMKNKDMDIENEIFSIYIENHQKLSFTLHSHLAFVMKLYMTRRRGKPEDFLFCNEQGQELSPMACHFQIQKILIKYKLDSFNNNELTKFYQEYY